MCFLYVSLLGKFKCIWRFSGGKKFYKTLMLLAVFCYFAANRKNKPEKPLAKASLDDLDLVLNII